MDVIRKCIEDLHFKIPRQILERVFVKTTGSWRQTHNNVDELIMAAVIRPRVLVDCDLVGGVEIFIPLETVPRERANDYTTVYRIPKQLTQGRSILSVSNITFTDPSKVSAYGTSATVNNNTLLRGGQAVMDAMGSIPITSTAKVQLIGENVVMVRDTIVLPANVYLRCTLANDENLRHIQPRSYRAFTKLFEFAVKSYIYNEYIVTMDMGELVGGQSLGVFKEIISGYSDAEELYETHLRDVIAKVSFMNDNETYTRFLKMIIGGNR